MVDRLARHTTLALLLTVTAVAADPATAPLTPPVSELRLRSQAQAAGPVVRLGDVLLFTDADPRLEAELAHRPLLDGQPRTASAAAVRSAPPVRPPAGGRQAGIPALAAFETSVGHPGTRLAGAPSAEGSTPAAPPGPGVLEVTHEQVLERLAALGVNRARVLLSGARVCRVTLASGSDARPGAEDGKEAGRSRSSVEALPADPQEPSGEAPAASPAPSEAAPASLRLLIQEHLERELRHLGGQVQVEFERSGTEFLDLTSPPLEFEIRSTDSGRLGPRELRVTIRQQRRTLRNVRVFVNVQLIRPVVVARRPLGVGVLVRPEDVGIEPRLFGQTGETGLERTEQVVGQQTQRFIPAGQMLRAADVKATDLVQRSRPVTLVNRASRIALRAVGTALDSGQLGQTVRVRIGESRRTQREVRGTVVGLGTVAIEEDE